MNASALLADFADIRTGTLLALEGLAAADWDWRPPGGANSIGDWVRHLAQAEDWFIRRVVQGQEMTPKRRAELPDRQALLDYLQQTRAYTLAVLSALDPNRMGEVRSLPEGYRGRPRPAPTLRWIFQNLIHHEIHHRAQILLYRRLMGKSPPAV